MSDFCPLPDPDVSSSVLACDIEHTSFYFGLEKYRLQIFFICGCNLKCFLLISGQETEREAGELRLGTEDDKESTEEEEGVSVVIESHRYRVMCGDINKLYV